MKKLIALILALILTMTVLVACDNGTATKSQTAPSLTFKDGASYKWETTNKKYKNFTDLGNYVIDLDPHENFDFDKAVKYSNERFDINNKVGCSALGTLTDSGDVIIGRNLDLTVSQFPCFISHLKYSKYETINFTYDELLASQPKYEDLLEAGEVDPDYYNTLPLLATDSMNSEGLYLEYNMRAYEDQFFCSGTNPKAKLRICSICLPFLVASNCATVEEALKYMNEELDIYTMVNKMGISGWNLCFMIGDATGEYGLIEIAKNEIRYLPEQHGQGNYYIYPEFNSISRGQSGYGRLQYGLTHIKEVQNDQDMANLMEKIMWKNEILNIANAYRDDQGHIHFCEDKEHKIESLDWRSDNVKLIPVNQYGEYVDLDADDAEARLVSEYKKCYDKYNAGEDMAVNKTGHDMYQEYLDRSDLDWVTADKNFEDLQKGLVKHYEDSGIKEKLLKYYAGDEKPLRDDSNIWTTALSFSVNCTQKRLTLKFWEEPDTVMTYQWTK